MDEAGAEVAGGVDRIAGRILKEQQIMPTAKHTLKF